MKVIAVLCVVSLVLFISLAPAEVRGLCKDYNITTYPLIAPAKNTSKIFHIGAFATWGSGSALGIMRLTIEELNQNMSIIPDVLFQLHSAELLKSTANALIASQALLNDINARGLVGGTYADETETGQLVASVYQTPQIAALPVGADLSNKAEYPYLARVNPPDEYQAAALASLMIHYGWEQAFVVYSNDDYGEPGLQDLQDSIKNTSIVLYSSVIDSASTNFAPVVEDFKQAIAKYNTRIFIIYIQSASVGVGLMNALNTAGLVGDDTGNTYIMTYAITYTFSGNPNSYNMVKYPFMAGAVGLTTRGAIASPLFAGLNATWNSASTSLFPGARPNPGSYWYFADAILTYAYALDNLMNAGYDFDLINGTTLMDQITKTNFSGVTGQVYFDQNYDRIGDYVWYNFNGPNVSSFSSPIAIYSAAEGQTTFQDGQQLIFYGNPHPVDGHALPVYKKLIPALSIALGVIIGIAVLVAFFALAMLLLFWETFRKHGSFFCGVMIIGVFFGYASALTLLPVPSDALCMLFPWLLGVGFTLVYGCLFIKTWTLYQVHRSAKQMKRTNLTPVYIIKGIGLYLCVEVIILMIWTIVDRPTVKYNKMVDGTYDLQCTTHPTFWAIFAAVKAAWLVFGAVLSIITRHVASEYSESKSIAYATYNITALLVIAIPLALVLHDIPGGYIIIVVGIIVIALTFTMCSLFFGIWMRIFFPDKDLPSLCATTPPNTSSTASPSKNSHNSSKESGASKAELEVVRI